MHAIDFTTALARLLCDSAQRDSFRANALRAADQLNVRVEDRAAFITLSPAELDAQADVLLRKRLDHVKRLAPTLCARLADHLWPRFREYARRQWPKPSAGDALHFCEHVLLRDAGIVSRTELNRLRFLASTARLRISAVYDLPIGNRERSGIQILLRGRNGRVRETWLYLAV